MLNEYYKKYKCPIIYVNQIGGQDELVFDGSSLVVGVEKDSFKTLKSFKTDSLSFKYEHSKFILENSEDAKESSKLSDIYDALVLGTRDYVEKNGFNGVIIGSSLVQMIEQGSEKKEFDRIGKYISEIKKAISWIG